MIALMGEGYRVRGGVGPQLPGVVGPADLDGRVEWVPVARTGELLDALAARLGSEVDLHKVVLAVLAPLRSALDGPPLGAIVARLPLSLARELAAGDEALGAKVRSPAGAGDYLLEVSRLILHPPWRAATYVRAVFAAARAVLAPEDAEAIAARLPPDLAELWRSAS
jgi:uncharacterized protein (DUF2267 family)